MSAAVRSHLYDIRPLQRFLLPTDSPRRVARERLNNGFCTLSPIRLLGLDPGLRFTGWGLIEVDGNRLRHLADGVIGTDSDTSVPHRLCVLYEALKLLIAEHKPKEAAVEETYVNRNGAATLKLGYARGVALLVPALAGLPVTEYGAKSVKRAVVGTGAADKTQVAEMVRRLLPGATMRRADASDALAVAICHAHNRATNTLYSAALAAASR
jgi:crossover junction endodeoxyribonuclease RuvC